MGPYIFLNYFTLQSRTLHIFTKAKPKSFMLDVKGKYIANKMVAIKKNFSLDYRNKI